MDLASCSSLEVGVISDTHVPHRLRHLPPSLFAALHGVDVILHAGDVDRPDALQPLRPMAPVFAVRGNLHVLEFSTGGASLPAVVKLRLAGRHVVLTHGCLSGPPSLWLKGRDLILRLINRTDGGRFNARIARRLLTLYPEADVIVFGHTHRVHVEWVGDTLLVNPGAVCPTLRERPSIARMTLGQGRPLVKIVRL